MVVVVIGMFVAVVVEFDIDVCIGERSEKKKELREIRHTEIPECLHCPPFQNFLQTH